MTRPVWTGTISFGLVSVPVKAYTATRDHAVHFHQLDRASGARVRNKTVSEKTGREVDRDQMVLGYEMDDGEYVTLERDELDDLRPASTRAIDVRDFVDLNQIDPIFYQRTYWLGPEGDAAKEPYALLLGAMEKRERAAIGSVVMRNKQYLTAVRPLDGALAMSTMRFADEVLDRSSIHEVPTNVAPADAKTLKLATQIIDSLAAEWDPEQYHDTYTNDVKTAIRAKAKGKGASAPAEDADETEGAEVLDLMAALKKSVEATKSSRSSATSSGTKAKSAKKTPAKKAPAKKATARKKPAKRAPAKKTARKSA